MTTIFSKEVEFDFQDEHFKAEYRIDRPTQYGRNKDPKHMRIYSHAPDSMMPLKTRLEVLADLLEAPSIYTAKGEYPELDKAWKWFNKEEVRVMTSLMVAALEALNDERLDKAFKYNTPKFSRTAGCSCGCSPGFVGIGRPGNEAVYINRYNAEEEAQAKVEREVRKAKELAALRAKVAALDASMLSETQLRKIADIIED